MRWTTTVPRKPGYYWLSLPSGKLCVAAIHAFDPEQIERMTANGANRKWLENWRGLAIFDGEYSKKLYMREAPEGAKWMGPIVPG